MHKHLISVLFSWVLLASALMLSGCVTDSIRGGLFDDVVIRDDFRSTLVAEYENLALFAEQNPKHEHLADYFRSKSKASSGANGSVAPDLPEGKDIPAFSRPAIETAYEMLQDAFDTMYISENKALLAIAQTRYDCWLAYRQIYKQHNAYFSCRDDFFKALETMTIPEDYAKRHNIYFDNNSIELTEDAGTVLKDVARQYSSKKHWTIVLIGHTDSKGSAYNNKVLSLRRAVSVKNALGQYGVDLDNIAISAKGEKFADTQAAVGKQTEPVAEEDEGLESDRSSRRVEIIFYSGVVTDEVIRDISESPGWTNIGGDS